MLRNLNKSATGRRILGIHTQGVLAENIPSTGTHGSGYAYPSLAFPGDNGVEVRGVITSTPVVTVGPGTLTSFFPYEDTSFDLVVTDDCTIQGTWDLYLDGVLDTSGLLLTVAIGAGGAIEINSDAFVSSNTSTVTVSGQFNVIMNAVESLSNHQTDINLLMSMISDSVIGSSTINESVVNLLKILTSDNITSTSAIDASVVNLLQLLISNNVVSSSDINETSINVLQTIISDSVASSIVIDQSSISNVASVVLDNISLSVDPDGILVNQLFGLSIEPVSITSLIDQIAIDVNGVGGSLKIIQGNNISVNNLSEFFNINVDLQVPINNLIISTIHDIVLSKIANIVSDNVVNNSEMQSTINVLTNIISDNIILNNDFVSDINMQADISTDNLSVNSTTDQITINTLALLSIDSIAADVIQASSLLDSSKGLNADDFVSSTSLDQLLINLENFVDIDDVEVTNFINTISINSQLTLVPSSIIFNSIVDQIDVTKVLVDFTNADSRTVLIRKEDRTVIIKYDDRTILIKG